MRFLLPVVVCLAITAAPSVGLAAEPNPDRPSLQGGWTLYPPGVTPAMSPHPTITDQLEAMSAGRTDAVKLSMGAIEQISVLDRAPQEWLSKPPVLADALRRLKGLPPDIKGAPPFPAL